MVLFSIFAGCGTEEPRPRPEGQVSPLPSPSSSQSSPSPASRAAAEAADPRPVILAFGNSLTAGYGVPPGSGYPDRLQEALDAGGFRYRVVNAGVSGDTTSGGLSRLASALAAKPAIVILELGGNDGLNGLPVEQMRANLEEMIVAFKGVGAKVVLGGMTLPRNYGMDYIAKFEKVFPELAKKHSLTLIPFFLEGAAGKAEFVLDDLIHPNEQGYRIVTETVLKYLTPLL
jgi:acyl-CoA thioesterase-1